VAGVDALGDDSNLEIAEAERELQVRGGRDPGARYITASWPPSITRPVPSTNDASREARKA
jgi:hypothetical protein